MVAHSTAYEILIQQDKCSTTHCPYNKYGFCKLEASAEVDGLPCEMDLDEDIPNEFK